MFKNAKVGDRVYSLLNGWGKIEDISSKGVLPVFFKGDNGDKNNFTFDGKHYPDSPHPVLFWDEPTIIAPEQPKPAPVAPPVDTLVEVRDDYGSGWLNRYSSGEMDGSILLCYDNGSSSKTTNERWPLIRWKHWRIVEYNDGWIEWNGGECPVPEGTLVDVRYRNGKENYHVKAGVMEDSGGSAPDWSATRWSNWDTYGDIIAYRLHKPC